MNGLELYFYICGILLNILGGALLSVVFWSWLLVPLVESFSRICWDIKCVKARGGKPKFRLVIAAWWSHFVDDHLGGRNFEALHCNNGSWYGIGNYTVLTQEEVDNGSE